MPFKLIWQTSQDGRRRYSEVWAKGAAAYLRGHHAGQPYFESLGTRDRKVAATTFAQRQAEIVNGVRDAGTAAGGRANFAWAVKNYFGPNDPAVGDPTGRIAKIFDKLKSAWLDEITQADIDRIATELLPSAAPQTRNREVYTPFVAVYNAAVEAGKAPQRKWRRPDGANKVAATNAPTDAKIKGLIVAATSRHGRTPAMAARNKAAILLMTLTGERTTAATVVVKWRDIDFDANTVFFGKTKNGEPRLVLMPPLLAAALRELAEFARGERDAPDPEALVFNWQSRSGMAWMIARARQRANVGKIRPHDLGRHGFGRRMRAAGLDRAQLKDAGNWKSDAAVARYDHFDRGEVARAVRDVDTSDLE